MEEQEDIAIPDGDYITLIQAAQLAGYSVPKGGSGNLRKAAQDGRLQTIRITSRLRLTTRAWMAAYLASLEHSKGGRPRKKPEDTLNDSPPDSL